MVGCDGTFVTLTNQLNQSHTYMVFPVKYTNGFVLFVLLQSYYIFLVDLCNYFTAILKDCSVCIVDIHMIAIKINRALYPNKWYCLPIARVYSVISGESIMKWPHNVNMIGALNDFSSGILHENTKKVIFCHHFVYLGWQLAIDVSP